MAGVGVGWGVSALSALSEKRGRAIRLLPFSLFCTLGPKSPRCLSSSSLTLRLLCSLLPLPEFQPPFPQRHEYRFSSLSGSKPPSAVHSATLRADPHTAFARAPGQVPSSRGLESQAGAVRRKLRRGGWAAVSTSGSGGLRSNGSRGWLQAPLPLRLRWTPEHAQKPAPPRLCLLGSRRTSRALICFAGHPGCPRPSWSTFPAPKSEPWPQVPPPRV